MSSWAWLNYQPLPYDLLSSFSLTDLPAHVFDELWAWLTCQPLYLMRSLSLTDLPALMLDELLEPDWPASPVFDELWAWLTCQPLHLMSSLSLTDLPALVVGELLEPDWPASPCTWWVPWACQWWRNAPHHHICPGLHSGASHLHLKINLPTLTDGKYCPGPTIRRNFGNHTRRWIKYTEKLNFGDQSRGLFHLFYGAAL